MFSPWLSLALAVIFEYIGLSFVLRAQGYPNGLKIKPKLAFWMVVGCEILALLFFVYPIYLLFC